MGCREQMQAAVERIQAKAELADDRRQLLGLLCLAVVHTHICASLGLDKKLIKSLLDLHHKVPCPAPPRPAPPRPAPPRPALPRPALSCPALWHPHTPCLPCHAILCTVPTVCLVQLGWFIHPDCPVSFTLGLGCCTHGQLSLMILLLASYH